MMMMMMMMMMISVACLTLSINFLCKVLEKVPSIYVKSDINRSSHYQSACRKCHSTKTGLFQIYNDTLSSKMITRSQH